MLRLAQESRLYKPLCSPRKSAVSPCAPRMCGSPVMDATGAGPQQMASVHVPPGAAFGFIEQSVALADDVTA
eukprot:970609-Prymnesium_polylepis.1